MSSLFATPGMIVVSALVLLLQAASLLFTGMLMTQFCRIHRKRVELLCAFGTCKQIPQEILQRRLLIVTYTSLSVLISGVSSFLFLTQPHLL
jgi:hypothetical protein